MFNTITQPTKSSSAVVEIQRLRRRCYAVMLYNLTLTIIIRYTTIKMIIAFINEKTINIQKHAQILIILYFHLIFKM